MNANAQSVTGSMNIRVRPEEKQQLQAEADAAGISLSELVRMRLMDKPSEEDNEWMAALASLKPMLTDVLESVEADCAYIDRVRLQGHLDEQRRLDVEAMIAPRLPELRAEDYVAIGRGLGFASGQEIGK